MLLKSELTVGLSVAIAAAVFGALSPFFLVIMLGTVVAPTEDTRSLPLATYLCSVHAAHATNCDAP
jgi:hypothetical protein